MLTRGIKSVRRPPVVDKMTTRFMKTYDQMYALKIGGTKYNTPAGIPNTKSTVTTTNMA